MGIWSGVFVYFMEIQKWAIGTIAKRALRDTFN
jgi:hypothetical protein